MADLLSYQREGDIAVITMDDGKANALSLAMLDALRDTLARAEKEQAAIVLAGRAGRFSGGFDLNVIREGSDATAEMVRRGFELSEQMLRFPRPLVIACTGHAIAMAAFVLLSGDYRVGAAGDFKVVANEVAIGLTMPLAAIELCRYRLTPPAYDKTVLLSEVFSPGQAVAAGFFDEVVQPEEVIGRACEKATQLTALNADAHAATKLRARDQLLKALRAAIEAEFAV